MYADEIEQKKIENVKGHFMNKLVLKRRIYMKIVLIQCQDKVRASSW